MHTQEKLRLAAELQAERLVAVECHDELEALRPLRCAAETWETSRTEWEATLAKERVR